MRQLEMARAVGFFAISAFFLTSCTNAVNASVSVDTEADTASASLIDSFGRMTQEELAYVRENYLVAPSPYTNDNRHPSSYVISPNPAPDTQTGVECSACSSAYILRFYGESADGVELYNQPTFPCKFSAGAFPMCFRRLFNEQYSDFTVEYYTGTTDDLKNAVSQGVPVIALLLYNGSIMHYVPVVGYDESHFYIQDSVREFRNVDDNNDYNESIELQTFDAMWNIPIESCSRLFVVVRKKR
ncbi:MAG: C39 family peptidase [Bacteroidales bacterium]|nr:C39 family peptidase [Bacteroidales bacterium]